MRGWEKGADRRPSFDSRECSIAAAIGDSKLEHESRVAPNMPQRIVLLSCKWNGKDALF